MDQEQRKSTEDGSSFWSFGLLVLVLSLLLAIVGFIYLVKPQDSRSEIYRTMAERIRGQIDVVDRVPDGTSCGHSLSILPEEVTHVKVNGIRWINHADAVADATVWTDFHPKPLRCLVRLERGSEDWFVTRTTIIREDPTPPK